MIVGNERIVVNNLINKKAVNNRGTIFCYLPKSDESHPLLLE
jgi:hypothetical protein